MLLEDEARLDELYRYCLCIEEDKALADRGLENERLKEKAERAQLRERRENREIRALKKNRRAELLESASSIFEWVSNFTRSLKGRKILSTIGEVVIFNGDYFGGKHPEHPGEEDFKAWLICDHNGLLRYREFFRSSRGRRRGKVLTTPEQMVRQLHPNYVLSVGDAIATGKVWNEVKYSIDWRGEIWNHRKQWGYWPVELPMEE